jgi:transposase
MARPLVDDDLWNLIEPLLPPVKPRRFRYPGRKPLTHRQALTGILFVLITGIPWEMLPQEMGCGSGVSCWRRLRDWQALGIWDELHALLLDELRRRDRIDLSVVAIDSSSVRAVGVGCDPAKKQAAIPPIARGRAPSTMLSPTARAFRLRARSRARMNPMAASSFR